MIIYKFFNTVRPRDQLLTINPDESQGSDNSWFDQLNFQYPLRKYQSDIIELCNKKLANGEKELHIVAPPGSGKTIIGLQIISQFKCPSLVICPNTTIQSQWAQKLDLFLKSDFAQMARPEILGTHEDRPLKPITILTYQALSVSQKNENHFLESFAHNAWIEELAKNQSLNSGDAEIRILDLKKNNPKAFKKELARHTKRLRRNLTDVLKLEEVLHENALALIQQLKRQQFALVIFDECHHLTDYWASVMIHLVRRLDQDKKLVVVGLTGTPPESKSGRQKARYLNLVGEIDYQVPTPALVKEGGLAPFQDLVYFTEPTENERQFLNDQHGELHRLFAELGARGGSSDSDATGAKRNINQLNQWVSERINENKEEAWSDFVQKKPRLAIAYSRYLYAQNQPLPGNLELSESVRKAPVLEDWIEILEDYALNRLKTSAIKEDQELFKFISCAIRKIGFSLSEKGIRKSASPVDRVLAYSRSKSDAVAVILDMEYASLQDRLRALVITDFEIMSPTVIKSVETILDPDAGGAIGIMKTLLAKDISQWINPCLVTGSRVLIDRRSSTPYLVAGNRYLKERGAEGELVLNNLEDEMLAEVSLSKGNWTTRLYVGLATYVFEMGITKCLIGTRGIFAEGWDSQQLNTVIDLTTSTSAVSVKQLRGRGIRLDSRQRKVANNWDIVCIAPELEKGLNDYSRFVEKHDGYFGIADDGQIECGVGHVHPSFSDLTPADVFASFEDFNEEMLKRALVRDQIYQLWQVGKPYANRQLGCVEISAMEIPGLQAPQVRAGTKYQEHAIKMKKSLASVWQFYLLIGVVSAIALAGIFVELLPQVVVSSLAILISIKLAIDKSNRLSDRFEDELCLNFGQEDSLRCIAQAVLSALIERRFLSKSISPDSIKISKRSDNSFRLFLDKAESDQGQIFIRAIEETLAPISNQPYLIPRFEFDSIDIEDRSSRRQFFKNYLSGKAEPQVGSYHAVPKLLARSLKGREAFENAWNKFVSPGFIVSTEEDPLILQNYFGVGPSLAERLLWD